MRDGAFGKSGHSPRDAVPGRVSKPVRMPFSKEAAEGALEPRSLRKATGVGGGLGVAWRLRRAAQGTGAT